MTVIFIALLHAVPVLVVGFWKENKSAITTAAIISGLVGVFTGNPIYMVQDIIGVVIGYYVASYLFLNNNASIKSSHYEDINFPEPEPQHDIKKKDSSWSGLDTGLTILVVIVILSYILSPHSVKPIHSNSQTPQQVQSVDKSNKSSESNSDNVDLRHCLYLSSNEAIIRCTEKKNK